MSGASYLIEESWLLSSVFQFGPRYRVYASLDETEDLIANPELFLNYYISGKKLCKICLVYAFVFLLDKGCKLESIS